MKSGPGGPGFALDEWIITVLDMFGDTFDDDGTTMLEEFTWEVDINGVGCKDVDCENAVCNTKLDCTMLLLADTPWVWEMLPDGKAVVAVVVSTVNELLGSWVEVFANTKIWLPKNTIKNDIIHKMCSAMCSWVQHSLCLKIFLLNATDMQQSPIIYQKGQGSKIAVSQYPQDILET